MRLHAPWSSTNPGPARPAIPRARARRPRKDPGCKHEPHLTPTLIGCLGAGLTSAQSVSLRKAGLELQPIARRSVAPRPRLSANCKGDSEKGVPNWRWAGGRGHPWPLRRSAVTLTTCLRPVTLHQLFVSPSPEIFTVNLTESQPRVKEGFASKLSGTRLFFHETCRCL